MRLTLAKRWAWAAAFVCALAGRAAAEDETQQDEELSDSDLLFEGDLVVDYERLYAAYGYELAERMVSRGVVSRPASRRNLDALIYDRWIWPKDDNGVVTIPITFASGDYTTAQQNTIWGHLNDLADQAGSWLSFVERTDEDDYVEIYSGSGCSSSMGYVSGKQQISLRSSGCLGRGTTQHEMLHTLGFWHEQSRPDRDDYVTINWDNIVSGKEHNFALRESRSFNSPYDYASVMHYRAKAFSKNGKNTITPPDGVDIGQRSAMSTDDVMQLKILYDDPDVTFYPTMYPTAPTTLSPTRSPDAQPTEEPTPFPTPKPTPKPTAFPTKKPTPKPTPSPTPTPKPTPYPTAFPTKKPTPYPTAFPTTPGPTVAPTPAPTKVCSTSDEQIWSDVRPDDLEDYSTLRECSETCTGSNTTCVADCVATSAGFTSPCSTCFANYVVCLEARCNCTYNTNTTLCDQCDQVETCDFEFRECTGVLSAVRYDATEGASQSSGVSSSMLGVIGGVGAGLACVLLASFALVARRRRRRHAKSTSPLDFGEAKVSGGSPFGFNFGKSGKKKKDNSQAQHQLAAPSFHRQTSFDV
ncbi:Zinc metalloproteinase nas-13 [Hondaea fermentalgiana]|uniref:Metalloendopeptidase n=1 Tax=Hondaea fermentalgiana TaxID=2315210 RepID=A0A2R5FYF4_9STRA|nr:Zinc metalloproteinase nas-13 [Hondaea fermentalgiana]|eukprot:GBG23787.1 Zinc metalloproteinase nas-13 [Hondaea fermentalgiana]